MVDSCKLFVLCVVVQRLVQSLSLKVCARAQALLPVQIIDRVGLRLSRSQAKQGSKKAEDPVTNKAQSTTTTIAIRLSNTHITHPHLVCL
jgi:hypothetical protein